MAKVEEILSFEDCSAILPGKQKIRVCSEHQALFAGWLVWWVRHQSGLALHLLLKWRKSHKMERDWQWAGGLHGRKGNLPQIAGMRRDAKMLMPRCPPPKVVFLRGRCPSVLMSFSTIC